MSETRKGDPGGNGRAPAEIVRKALLMARAGDVSEAERLCRDVLAGDPDCFDALALLGLLAHEGRREEEADGLLARACAARPGAADVLAVRGLVLRALGRHEEALAALDEALASRPDFFEALFNRGNTLLTLNRHEEALAAFDRALAVQADDTGALTHRGVALQELGRVEEALASHTQALALRPESPEALTNRGHALLALGRVDLALESLDRALELAPDHAPALVNRGNGLRTLGRLDEALESLRQALAIRPNDEDALSNAAAVLSELGRHQEAIGCCDQALAVAPRHVEALRRKAQALQALNRHDEALPLHEAAFSTRRDAIGALGVGNALQALGRYDEALAAFDRAIDLESELADALNNRGNALRALGRHQEALDSYMQAIARRPGDVDAHQNEGLTRLILGDFERGWEKYEWRRRGPRDTSPRPRPEPPTWLGTEDLAGKTILLHPEQGFGDAIQFIRYAPLVAERGARVVATCPEALVALFRTVPGVQEVLEPGAAVPEADYQALLMSLPLAFRTRLDSIPADIPYVAADPQHVESWRTRLAAHGARRNIGLAWRGNPEHPGAYTRDCPSNLLAPLLDVPDCAFFSLQRDEGAADIDALASRDRPVVDLNDELGDFHETAAAISALDLVISVDTAVAHLAGALGRPAWVMLSFAADWRWLANREDSPWYPSLRLFRQATAGDWEGVLRRVAGELTHLGA